MAGLLDFLNSDEAALGLGLLAAGGPSTVPMSFGQRLAQGVDFARQRTDGAEDRRYKRQLMQSQLDENASQAEYRKAQIADLLRKREAQEKFWAAVPPPGGGAGGAGPGAAGGSGGGLIEGMTADQIARAKASGIGDFTELWKATRPDMVEIAPGVWADKRRLQAGTNQAALDARTRDRIEQSDIGMRGDFVEVEDTTGRKWKVPKASLVGGGAGAPPAPRALPGGPLGGPRTYSSHGLAGGNSTAAASGQLEILTSELTKAQDELVTAQQRGDAAAASRAQSDIAGLQREIGRLPGGGRAAAPAPTAPLIANFGAPPTAAPAGMPPGAIPSGMSRAEADAADVAKLKATEQVKADVVPTQQAANKFNAAADAIKVINKALTHPGLGTATGLAGMIDPRNYVPGTNAKDFQVVLDQLRGTAFLSAYNELKGGGAITEVEGRKAEDAIARLNRAQTTEAFTEALNDYKAVLERGLRKAGASDADLQAMGASSRSASGPVTPPALPPGWTVKVK